MLREEAMAGAQAAAAALGSLASFHVSHARERNEIAITIWGDAFAYSLAALLALIPGCAEIGACLAYETQEDANDPDEDRQPAIRAIWRYS